MKNTKLLALLGLVILNSVMYSMENTENIIETNNQSYLNDILPNEMQTKIIDDIVEGILKKYNYKFNNYSRKLRINEQVKIFNEIAESLTNLSYTSKHLRIVVIEYINRYLRNKLEDNNIYMRMYVGYKSEILFRAIEDDYEETVKFIIKTYGIRNTELKHLLCYAIKHKQDSIQQFLQELVNKNIPVKTRLNTLNHAFLAAAEIDDINKMKELIKIYGTKYIDSCKRSFQSESALQRALKNGNEEMVKLLIDNGANINFANSYGQNTHILIDAIEDNNIDLINLILKYNSDINYKIVYGKFMSYTALMYAAYHGNIDIVKLLIQAQADVNAHNEMGQTALEIAIRHNHENIARLLIENQANIDVINPKTNTTMLEDTIKGCSPINLTLLLKLNANINAINHIGETPLMCAVRAYNINALLLLIKAGANIKAKNKDGHNALVIAAINNRRFIVELFLKSTGISADYSNMQAFECALGKNNLDMAKLILINTPETYISRECIERVIFLAMLNKNEDIIDMLKSCGRIDQHFIAHVCLNSMLIIGILQGRLDIVKQLINDKIINKQIGKVNININFIDLNGNTALINATRLGYTQIVQLLLDAGADINIKDKFNKTALDYAIELGHMDIIIIIKNSSFSIKRIKAE